jgi:translation initiation factor 1 (eIF-1/SUI1)
MGRSRPTTPETPSSARLGTLGDLLKRQGVAGPAAEPAPAVPPPGRIADPDVPDLAGCGKITLRRERKGHGGRTVTVVAGLRLDPQRLERIARALRRTLGAGATVDGDLVVVQGDLMARVQAWLAAHGARRIVAGS